MACHLLDEVYGLDTNDRGALMRKDNCLLAQGYLQESVALLERTLALYPEDPVLIEQLHLARTALMLS